MQRRRCGRVALCKFLSCAQVWCAVSFCRWLVLSCVEVGVVLVEITWYTVRTASYLYFTSMNV
jgi:hypothetical protein